MVKKIAIFFTYFVFFISCVFYFTPKVNIYYLAEKYLEKSDVVIGSEYVVDNGFSLTLNDAKVFVKSIKSANISQSDIKFFILYNSIDMHDIKLSKALKSFIPLHIEDAEVKYFIFNPLNLKIYAEGEFGKVDGYFNLKDRLIHLNLKPSKLMLRDNANTLRNFKREKDGEFSYEKTF
jgi:hypothetical protein